MNRNNFENPFTLDSLKKSFDNADGTDTIALEALERQNPLLVDIKRANEHDSALITCPVCKLKTIINYELYKIGYKEWYCKQCGQRLVLEKH